MLQHSGINDLHFGEEGTLEFDQPVNVGEGLVHAEIADQKNPLLVYDTQDARTDEVFRIADNPLVVLVNISRFSFHPYATYRLKWEEGAFLTMRNQRAVGGSASFSTIDESCVFRQGSQEGPVFCKYYAVAEERKCYCFGLF